MGKGLTEIIFILDRSGSMSGLESDTIGGFNSMIRKQKKERGRAYITTVLFDDRVEILHDRKRLAELEPITEKDYFVRGTTALLDAVGETIRHVEHIHYLERKEDRPDKTMVVITTDGMENSSSRFSYEKVNRMVKKKQEKCGWEFVFFGANLDAAEMADKIGVKRSHAANYMYDGEGVGRCYESVSMVMQGMTRTMEKPICIPDFLKNVREDYAARSGTPEENK